MLNSILNTIKKDKLLFVAELITLAAIVSTGIIFDASFIEILPLCISLLVMFLQANVSRYTFILGAVNSLIYAIPYYQKTLYLNMASSILTSCPFQIAAFVKWDQKTKNDETEIRRLTNRQRVYLGIGTALIWVIAYFILAIFDSQYLILDNTTAVLAIVASLMSIFRFMEYTLFQVLTSVISIVMFVVMTLDDPANIPWLIYTVYSLFCIVLSFVRMTKQNKRQTET